MRILFRNIRVLCSTCFLLLSLIYLTQVSCLTGDLKSKTIAEIQYVEKSQNDIIENLHTMLRIHTDTEEHHMRIRQQLVNYKKGIESYVN